MDDSGWQSECRFLTQSVAFLSQAQSGSAISHRRWRVPEVTRFCRYDMRRLRSKNYCHEFIDSRDLSASGIPDSELAQFAIDVGTFHPGAFRDLCNVAPLKNQNMVEVRAFKFFACFAPRQIQGEIRP